MTTATAPDNQLATIVNTAGLVPASAQQLIDTFAPMYAQAHPILEESRLLHVTDVTQTADMERAGDLRGSLADIRIMAGKKHKLVKADALVFTRTVDLIERTLRTACEVAEAELEKSQNFKKHEDARKAVKLLAERCDLLRPYADPIAYPNLGTMTESQWAQVFTGAKLAKEAADAAEVKRKADEAEAERGWLAVVKQLREENERIKAEQAEKERLAKIESDRIAAKNKAEQDRLREERRLADAAAQAERDAAVKLERDLADAAERDAKKAREETAKLKAEADAKAKAEADQKAVEAKAAKLAAAAPDREKLKAWADALVAVRVGEVATPEGCRIVAETAVALGKLVATLVHAAEGLGGK